LHVHIYASDVDVLRAVRRKFKRAARRNPAFREERKRVYREMLAHHHAARNLAREFRI
jgi:GrpB-like predicted nucleotidyltransferase (UPF0157 family)